MTLRPRPFALVALAFAFVVVPSGAGAATYTPLPDSAATDGYIYTLLRDGDRVLVGGAFRHIGPRRGSGAVMGAGDGSLVGAPGIDQQTSGVVPDSAGGWFVDRETDDAEIAHVRADGRIDTGFTSPTFGPGPSYRHHLQSLAVAGGRLLAGGTFESVNGVARRGLVALDPATGAPDMSYPDLGLDQVNVLTVDGGRVYAGGRPRTPTLDEQVVLFDAASGAVDPGFTARVNDTGLTTMARLGSRLYLAGGFGTVNGTAHPALAAVDATTGELDTAFAPDLRRTVARGQPELLALAAGDGRLYAAGRYLAGASGHASRGVVALDAATGAPDTGFTSSLGGVSFEPSFVGVTDLALAGGRLYTTGFFTAGNGHADGLAALDAATGAVDTLFAPGTTSDLLTVSVAGDRVFAGGFSGVLFGSLTRSGLAAVDVATGAVRSDFDVALQPPGSSTTGVWTLARGAGRFYVGGDFTTQDGRRNLVAIAPGGALLRSFTPRPDGIVRALVASRTRLYASGDFTRIGGLRRAALASLLKGSGRGVRGFAPFPASLRRGFGASVGDLVLGGGRLIVSGNFMRIGGRLRNGLAALSLTSGRASRLWKPGVVQGGQLVRSGSRLYVGYTRGASHIVALRISDGRLIRGFRRFDSGSDEEVISGMHAADGLLYVGLTAPGITLDLVSGARRGDLPGTGNAFATAPGRLFIGTSAYAVAP